MKPLLWLLLLTTALWFAIGCITFQYRHYWATDEEISRHFKDAILFRRVPKSRMEHRQ